MVITGDGLWNSFTYLNQVFITIIVTIIITISHYEWHCLLYPHQLALKLQTHAKPSWAFAERISRATYCISGSPKRFSSHGRSHWRNCHQLSVFQKLRKKTPKKNKHTPQKLGKTQLKKERNGYNWQLFSSPMSLENVWWFFLWWQESIGFSLLSRHKST